MELSDVTVEYIKERTTKLKSVWSKRNDRMDEYEKIYLLDLWEDKPAADEKRVNAPVGWNIVESYRTLLLTRPPVIDVPPSEINDVAEEQADTIERYLYGVWYRAQVLSAADGADWAANCLGDGVLRCVYDDQAAEGDFPLMIDAVDPRTVFPVPGRRGGQDAELLHIVTRPRREIEAEFGKKLKGRPSDRKALASWLDAEVEEVNYWRVDVVTVEEEPKRKAERLVGAFERVVRRVLRMAPEGEVVPGLGVVVPDVELVAGEEEVSGAGKRKKRQVRRRLATHAVVVDDRLLKKAVRMPGYGRIPFLRYPGISTLLPRENGALSVLFPVTAGQGIGDGTSTGLIAAQAELLGYKQRLIEMFANGALITDDKNLTEIDWDPSAINYVAQGRKWDFLIPPGPHPSVDQQMGVLERLTQDATVSAAMQGRYVGDISGIALSAINNPVLMRIAHRQRIRERAYQDLNELVLSLTEQYAVAPRYPDGWAVWGQDRVGQTFEETITPGAIGGYRRNRVKLSASLPRDEAGEILGLANLVTQGLISRETFLDQLQHIKQLSSQSPRDEMQRILRDRILHEGPLAQKLGELLLSDYSPDLARVLGVQQPQPPPPAAPGPGAGPPGPMGGLPPSVLPPGEVPPAVGAGGPERLAAMLRMQGALPPEEE